MSKKKEPLTDMIRVTRSVKERVEALKKSTSSIRESDVLEQLLEWKK
jgi:hypothetical protein